MTFMLVKLENINETFVRNP